MSVGGMFPESGVPPTEAINSLPDPATTCQPFELWYDTGRCYPRFDPTAANAMLAELINLINKAEVTYNCTLLDQVQLANRYLIQRGLPRAAYMVGGPNAYTGVLDPPATRYNDYMTLTVIPAMTCKAQVTFDAGRGAAYILRNDGQHLDVGDLRVGKPQIIAYYQGYWYMCGLAASQVPLLVKGGIDCWIRTDGNDQTGDGTVNHPSKAFRTINGCWYAVGSRYAATPLFSINMRLGIPGDYEAGNIGNFGGNVSLTGDPNNYTAYRILSTQGNAHVWAFACSSMNMSISGVNFVMRHSSENPNGNNNLRISFATCSIVGNIQFTLEASSPNSGRYILCEGSSWIGAGNAVNVVFEGNGNTILCGLNANGGALSYGTSPGTGPFSNWHWRNTGFTGASHMISDQAVYKIGCTNYYNSNTWGSKYNVQTNAVLDRQGQSMPGNSGGTVGSQGQVF